MPLELNKEEWLDWYNHPITQHFFERIKEQREHYIAMLAYNTPESEKKQDQMIGTITAFTTILDVNFEEA